MISATVRAANDGSPSRMACATAAGIAVGSLDILPPCSP
jgi:hypothetical protein